MENIKEVESIKDINKENFSLSFKDIFKTGNIGNNNYFVYDYSRSCYVYFNKETGDREIYSTSDAKHKLFEVFFENGVELKSPERDLKYLKKINLEFDFEKEDEWVTPLNKYLNEFSIKKTNLEIIYQLREFYGDSDLINNTKTLKKTCPKIHALLFNLLEENEEAVNHFINWITSFIFTRKKIRTAMFFVSEKEGTGKGVLVDELLADIFNKDYVVSIQGDQLKDNFNNFLDKKLIVNFNEISSDFIKHDVTTQKLKQLITDSEFTLNEKYGKQKQAKNNFLVMLSSNNPNSVKMSNDDRRFNYFFSKKTLREVAKEKFNLEIEDFIKSIKKEELLNFYEFLAKYNYNYNNANKLLETKSKKISQKITSSPVDYMFNLIKKRDIKTIKEEIDEVVYTYNLNNDKSKYSDSFEIFVKESAVYLKDLEEEFKFFIISNDSLNFLYCLLVDDTKTKADRSLNKIFLSRLGAATNKTLNGKTKRFRLIDEKQNEMVQY